MAANNAEFATVRAPGEPAPTLTVWYFTDGKAGHESQVRGLLAALRERVPVDDYAIPASRDRFPLVSLLGGRDACGKGLPDPDLIIGAGHATHLPMLAARRARGGRVVVLMKPTLPLRCFDLCAIPSHDRPPARPNVMLTHGALNRVRASDEKQAGEGLMLIGGPSPHVDWSDYDIVRQVETVVEYSPDIHWHLTTSRRTPRDLLFGVDSIVHNGRLTVVPFEETGPDWLPEKLATAAYVWVSGDSVSMVYEALTSGAAVGLFSVHYRKDDNRLARGMRELQQAGLVLDFEVWRRGDDLQAPIVPLNEAGRCADLILEKWPPGG